MKQVIFGIFAHPDDEAFGPSGTLTNHAEAGADVHLICVTDGSSGVNVDGHDDLAAIRIAEWEATGQAIGVTSQKHFGYKDGQLCNNMFHQLTDDIERHIVSVLATYAEPVEISFITFEPQGISGHIDHITVSFATSYVFTNYLASPPLGHTMKELLYFCISDKMAPTPNTGFVYMPRGRSDSEIDHIEHVDLEKKIATMKLHHSQRGDAESIIARGRGLLAEERFMRYGVSAS